MRRSIPNLISSQIAGCEWICLNLFSFRGKRRARIEISYAARSKTREFDRPRLARRSENRPYWPKLRSQCKASWRDAEPGPGRSASLGRCSSGRTNFGRERRFRGVSVVQVHEIAYARWRSYDFGVSAASASARPDPSLVETRKTHHLNSLRSRLNLSDAESHTRIVTSRQDFRAPPFPSLPFCKEDGFRNHFPRIAFAIRSLSESRELGEMGGANARPRGSSVARLSPRTSVDRGSILRRRVSRDVTAARVRAAGKYERLVKTTSYTQIARDTRINSRKLVLAELVTRCTRDRWTWRGTTRGTLTTFTCEKEARRVSDIKLFRDKRLAPPGINNVSWI